MNNGGFGEMILFLGDFVFLFVYSVMSLCYESILKEVFVFVFGI